MQHTVLEPFFWAIKETIQKIAKLSPQILRQKRFPFSEMGVESIFPLRRLGIVDFWGQKNAIYGWFRWSPARRFYGLAALSKAWREMNFPNYHLQGTIKIPPRVFPSFGKNPKFFVVDENPPTIEVTTTRFIVIFWCCSCLKHPTNMWRIRNLEFLKSLLNLAPSLFWVIFGILKTPSFKFKAPISLKLFFFSHLGLNGYHIQNFQVFNPN